MGGNNTFSVAAVAGSCIMPSSTNIKDAIRVKQSYRKKTLNNSKSDRIEKTE